MQGHECGRTQSKLNAQRKYRSSFIKNNAAHKLDKLCEKNWFILSVSLFMREIRSPALFWLKNATGNSCSLLNIELRNR